MSASKIAVIIIIIIIAGVGIVVYLRSLPQAYAPQMPDQNQAAVTPPSAPTEEQELGAIPVDNLGKEMQDIDAELAK